jgi:hypothetical protein
MENSPIDSPPPRQFDGQAEAAKVAEHDHSHPDFREPSQFSHFSVLYRL